MSQYSGLRLRASSMPRFLACPASECLGHVQTAPGAAAQFGTAVHSWAESWVIGQENRDVEKLAVQFGCDARDLEQATWAVRALWEILQPHFPQQLMVEQRMGPFDLERGVSITGHADLVSSPGDGTLRLLDWKTGWRDEDYYDQLRTYALLAMKANPSSKGIEHVYCAIGWTKTRTVDGAWFEAAELTEFEQQIIKAATWSPAKNLRVGDHCRYCPVASCPAMRERCKAILPDEGPLSYEITEANVLEAWAFMQRAEDLLKTLKMEIQRVLAQGAVASGEGRELALQQVETEKLVLDNQEVFSLLLGEYGMEVCSALSLSKEGIKDLVMKSAEKGQKTAAWEAFMARMREMGAVQAGSFEKITQRKVQS